MSSPSTTANSTPQQATPSELEEIHQLIKTNQFVPALTALMQQVAQDVRNPKLWLLIGLAYTRMSDWKPAIEALQTVLELDPREVQAEHLMAMALFSTGRKQEACDLIDKVVKKGNLGPQWMMRAYIHAHTSRDPMLALQAARDWGRRFADPLTRKAKPLKVVDRSPRKKLRVGYVTADFRQHSVAFFMQPVLAHHNPDNVEVHVYSNGPSDSTTEHMRSLVPHWLDVMEMDDEALCERIRQDEIDVLVDLSGFTQGHRLGVFARRAAPVQVTWLGYMQTLGMKAMDYRLGGPASVEKNYFETLFRLDFPFCYTPPFYDPLCEEPPMLRNGYPTLISLNNSSKITDEMLRLWARILHKRTDIRLIIMVKEENPEAAQAHMQPRVEAANLPLDRVSVLHQQPLDRFMELGHIADIALDTSPVSGGTTTLHALWMGLLIVALDVKEDIGATTSRALRSLKLGGEIAENEDDYIDCVLKIIDDPSRMQRQRHEARDLLRNSFLMNFPRMVKGLEKAYRLMWLNFINDKKEFLHVNEKIENFI
ncbi:glycosyltransferase [Comamonas sp. Tr-654]|uniref:O-linked N-acetylglucosamine transferase, SPINDLY family protein n=1 Tax=Comamonas sp. Tr-654 TaxID=2608341 RepID=UPI00141E1706|nr:glycosyltransferase [Comamonas sp. Tr-654]NIF86432.1 glycosyltransferase [Comamonas sp. Tr-654]